MSDNVEVVAAAAIPVAADAVTYSGDAAQLVQLARIVQVTGAEGSKTVVDLPGDASNGLDVDVTRVSGTVTVDASGFTVPVSIGDVVQVDASGYAIQVTAGGAFPVNDNSGSLTVDAPVGTPAFVRLSDGSAAIATLPVSIAADINVLARRGLVGISVQSGGLTTASTAYTAGDQVGTQFTFAGCARAAAGSGTIIAIQLVDAADIIGAYDVVITSASITPAADNAAFAISDSDALLIIPGGIVQLAGAYDIGNNRIGQASGLAIPYVCGATSLFANLICRVGHTFFAAATNLQLILYVELN